MHGFFFERQKKYNNFAFQKILDKCNCKPNKVYGIGSEVFNRSVKSWLHTHTHTHTKKEMYSTHKK